MTITHALIEQGKSERGGYTREQVELLGGEWPLREGWQSKLIGKEITIRTYGRFLSLQGQLARPRKAAKGRRSVVKSDLPIPPGFPPAVETVLASFHLFISRLSPEVLKITLPLLEFIVRSARKRAAQ